MEEDGKGPERPGGCAQTNMDCAQLTSGATSEAGTASSRRSGLSAAFFPHGQFWKCVPHQTVQTALNF